jgi:anhydro-N-acetylmuramic acid kinase
MKGNGPGLIDVLLAAQAGRPLMILGMMSGTSVDGIDAALCRIAPRKDAPDRLHAETVFLVDEPIPDVLRQRIFEVFHNGPGSLEIATGLGLAVGRAYATAAAEALKYSEQQGSWEDRPSAVAVHGQTLWHSPPPGPWPGTFQCIDPSVIADMTGLTVVGDFRRADMAAGGQGAPLVPFYDWNQYSHPEETRAILNIGGIANITVLPAGRGLEAVTGFDTGPGNVLMDLLAQRFMGKPCDHNGAAAHQGQIIPQLLNSWMQMDYFHRQPPKSTGREVMGMAQLEQCVALINRHPVSDFLATAAEWTAQTIAWALRDYVPQAPQVRQILVAGGGALNAPLLQRIERCCGEAGLPQIQVQPVGGHLEVKAREAAAFAMIGYATLAGRPGNVPAATGADRSMILGTISPPGYRFPSR